MARSHIAIAATATLAFVLLVVHFLSLPGLSSEVSGSQSSIQGLYASARARFSLRTAPTSNATSDSGQYVLGVGKADITGPVVEIGFMGYASLPQVGTGLRQRIYSRAFIMGSPSNPQERICYMVLDTQSGDTAIRYGILQGLATMGPEYAVYTKDNIAVTGTHSHSGPGAWLNYLLPQVTTKGFDDASYNAIVQGALLSIQRAHESLTPGSLTFGTTRIEDANINRSLFAYLNNPADERAKYGDDTVDKNMTLLRFTRADTGKDMGVLTWFPVHGTAMLENNTLVTGDNKGVAATLFEKAMQPGFVAGFSQANVGDTSPNIDGAYCESGVDEGQECKLSDSTCGGKNEPCHGRGPFWGLNDFGTKSCYTIGTRQFTAAQSLLTDMQSGQGTTPISGAVASFHSFKDFSNYTFTLSNGTLITTCPGALGYGFAAGTTDGPGAFDFKQNDPGTPNASPVWIVVRDALHTPSEKQIKCQQPKPILLDSGETTFPYDWSPNIVDIQMMRVGQLLIIVSPGEATTMSGRRWKESIATAARTTLFNGDVEPIVVLGAPANTYTHYIATPEEYAIQRYEGASTLFGQQTLNAYINATTDLLPYLSSKPPSAALDAGPSPPINIKASLRLNTPVAFDSAGLFKSYGDIVTDVQSSQQHVYAVGENVTATFIGANPRNNFHLEGTFAAVEMARSDASGYDTVADDSDWELTFQWLRTSTVLATSQSTISWVVPSSASAGTYRLVYNGDSKAISGTITPFTAYSQNFALS